MPIDPELAQALAVRAAAATPPTDLGGMRAAYAATGASLPRPSIGEVTDHQAPTRDGSVPVRLYRPQGLTSPPVLIFLHGGGFMFGDLDSHDAACRHLVAVAGCAVLAVAYRLAPEHPFPAGLEDCEAAAEWLFDQAAALKLDARRVAIGGESAGGNLAAVLGRKLAGRAGERPILQLLIHPATDFRFEAESISDLSSMGLTRGSLEMMRGFYLREEAAILDPDASPALAEDLTGLAPAVVLTVEGDPLRDEGEAYGLRLAQAGVETTILRLPGLVHGFMFEAADIRVIGEAFETIGALVRRGFGEAPARQTAR